MKTKRILKLQDNRACGGSIVREMRSTLKGIESGEVVGIGMVTLYRDGSARTKSNFECPIKGLGACDLLRTWIIDNHFKRS